MFFVCLTHQIWRENVDLLPKIAQMLVVVYDTEQMMFNAKMGYTYKNWRTVKNSYMCCISFVMGKVLKWDAAVNKHVFLIHSNVS